MEWDETQAKPKASGHTVGEPLDKLSKDELHSRLQSLESEITRLKSEIEKKKAHEAAASELFTGKD